jgi:hypothetical protein
MYSIKKVSFDMIVDVGDLNIFSTTSVPQNILQFQSNVMSGANLMVASGGSNISIDANVMSYLTSITERTATYVNSTTVTVAAIPAINPVTTLYATKSEFDVYINGQYVEEIAYTWTPAGIAPQTIVIDPNILGYEFESTDLVIVKGRWA